MGLPEPPTATPPSTPTQHRPLLSRCRSSHCVTSEPSAPEMPRAFKSERSVSCPVRGSADVVAGERFVRTPWGVAFESEAFRLQTEARIAYLLETASSPASSSANALLAQKTLKYRRVDVAAAVESAVDRFR
jgi:hypothetical protein